MPRVKIHYTVQGSTEVITTISANVSTVDFLMRGLPGQPEGYRPVAVETPDGTVLEDWSRPPPDTVYVVVVKE